MVGEDGSMMGLTLPPKVVGKVRGHLVMKVDEVLWARKPPGEVSAVVMWWGEEEPTTFRPTDIAQNATKRTNRSVIYEVRTSPNLFENYLRKCGNLEIAMADRYGMPIGCASVTNLWQMISKCPYQNYYPIINNFGNRIGDLHVSFNLRMLPNVGTENDVPISKTPIKLKAKTKSLKRLSAPKGKQHLINTRSKDQVNENNEQNVKAQTAQAVVPGHLENSLCSPSSEKRCTDISQKKASERRSVPKEVSTHINVDTGTSTSKNIISEILEHGTRLRDAMTASVMEDGLQQNLIELNHLKERQTALETLHFRSQAGTDSIQASKASLAQPYAHSYDIIDNQMERKVLDYLSGKPMSHLEEEEALAALRGMTPSRERINNTTIDSSSEVQSGNSRRVNNETDTKKLSEEMPSAVSDCSRSQAFVNNSEYTFDVDSQLISQINCLRITIRCLILNSIGIKRIWSFSQKNSSSKKSGTTLHPPGATFFVEYDFPVLAKSRRDKSKFCYCSKRLNGHEVSFGDKTIHNLPATWRSSISDLKSVDSLISSFSFKVCARYLHQRVPVCLGLAKLVSAKSLVESANLRLDYDLPVVGADNLPVAQLRICLELGRDRIHFGGLFDPENNSLGVRSPCSSSSLKKIECPTSQSNVGTLKKRPGRSITTVTRNITQNGTCGAPPLWKEGISSLQAAQADRVIKKLVSNASIPLKLSSSSESSSVPSTARLQFDDSSFTTEKKISSAKDRFKPGAATSGIHMLIKDQTFKHEVALSILKVIDFKFLRGLAGNGEEFHVTYTFPVWNPAIHNTVQWTTVTTEPLMCESGTWERPQNNIHATVLPGSKPFHAFLKHAFELQGNKITQETAFCFCLHIPSQNLKVAEAYLPLRQLLNLEEAYNQAAISNPNFSSSSCSSIVLDLPFEFCFPSEKRSKKSSFMKLKVDYRHSVVENSSVKTPLPHSRGDSVTDSVPMNDFKAAVKQSKGTSHKLVLPPEGEGRPLVPNWARSPDKKVPPSSRTAYFSNSIDPISRKINSNWHASWEPVPEKTIVPFPEERFQNSRYRHSQLHRKESHRSLTNLTLSDDHTSDFECERRSSQLSSPSLNSLDLQDVPPNPKHNVACKMCGKADVMAVAAPQRLTSTKATDPIPLMELVHDRTNIHHKSTTTEQSNICHDTPSQATVHTATEGVQTSPKISPKRLWRDVGTSADLENLPTEIQESPMATGSTSKVASQCFVDDVEIVDVESEDTVETPKSSSNDSREEEISCKLNLKESDTGVCPGESSETGAKERPEFSKSSIPTFRANIGVECALHVQSLRSIKNSEDVKKCFMFVSCNPSQSDGLISEIVGMNPDSVSPAVFSDVAPEWHWQSQIQLPTDLLFMEAKRLIFKIWETEKDPHEQNLQGIGSNNLIGFSVLDLTVLAAGLPIVSGWFNIMDFAGACRGQIKLSVEPLENISAFVPAETLPVTTDFPKNSSQSLYVAHCTYPEFPSHVTQFSDMRVHKVDPQPLNQAMSKVLSGYQLLSLSSDKVKSKPFSSTKEGSAMHSSPADLPPHWTRQKLPSKPTQASASELTNACGSTHSSATASVDQSTSNFSYPQQGQEASCSETSVVSKSDPSILLREKLSELEQFVQLMKEGLLDSSQQKKPSVPVKDCKGTCEHDVKGAQCNAGPLTANENAPSINYQKQASPKQRKTWEKQEDLIDLGALYVDCKDNTERYTTVEDVAEWLSESALQQVFSPLLFNDILNSFNSSRGVQVIELDENGNSDDNTDLKDAASSSSHGSESTSSCVLPNEEENECPRRNRRGDETYRKGPPCHSLNDMYATQLNNRSGFSAGDTDSGVDVDVSAGFFVQPEAHHAARFMPLANNARGNEASRVEREECYSSSCTSSRQQSAGPSSSSASVSATPTDSPQHSCQGRLVQPNCSTAAFEARRRVLGKRRSAGECERHTAKE